MNNPRDKDVQLYRYEDDEISFSDLYRTLIKRRLLILLVFAATILFAILYLFMAQPVYEAKVRLLLPNSITTSLTVPPHPYSSFEPTVVFNEFQAQLKLMEQWYTFVENNPNWFRKESDDEMPAFGENPIRFSQDKNFPGEHVEVAYQYNSQMSSAEILRQYLGFSRENYVRGLLDLVKNKIEREKKNIELDIAMLRKRASLAKDDEIERLRRDLALAKTLGITDNILVRSSEASRVGSDISIIATNETVRSYMRGTNVLHAELDALLKRESNDPYIGGLREKQIELDRLENLRISSDGFMPYMQDGGIISPPYPKKPRKIMVMAQAAILGLMLGVFLAIFLRYLRGRE